MKNVLITGSSGFIGRRLAKKIKDMNVNVIPFNTLEGDIKSPLDINNFLEERKIDYIFHLAGSTYVPDSWLTPTIFYLNNTIGTLNLLEICRERNIGILYISAYIYGFPEVVPIKETSNINPNNPYAHSKYLAEQLCKFYAEHYGVKASIVRPFNVYGPEQSEKFLIPHIIKQIMNNDEVQVNDLLPKRDYIYVDDLVDALIKIWSKNNDFAIYNVGYGQSYSVKEIISVAQEIAGTDKPIVCKNDIRNNEISNVVSDTSYIKKSLAWQPKVSLRQGLKMIIDYEREK